MDELKKTYRVTLFIGVAMIISLLIYAALVEVLKANFKPFRGLSPTTEIEILRYLFFAIAIAEFFLIKFMRNRLLSKKRPPSGASTPKGSFSPGASKLMSVTILIYALCESVAILGLVLFLIAGSSRDFYIFLIIALFFYGIYFPRYRQWEEWVR